MRVGRQARAYKERENARCTRKRCRMPVIRARGTVCAVVQPARRRRAARRKMAGREETTQDSASSGAVANNAYITFAPRAAHAAAVFTIPRSPAPCITLRLFAARLFYVIACHAAPAAAPLSPPSSRHVTPACRRQLCATPRRRRHRVITTPIRAPRRLRLRPPYAHAAAAARKRMSR